MKFIQILMALVLMTGTVFGQKAATVDSTGKFFNPPTSQIVSANSLVQTGSSGTTLLFPGTLSIASGKTLTSNNNLTFSGTDGSTLNIGTGGTLGTAAYTASSSYDAAGSTKAWSLITSTPTTISGYGITDPIVLTSGSYSNPSWITALAWSKLTGTPTTLSGYGITNGQTTLSFGTGLTLTSTNVTVNTSQNIGTLSNLTSNGFIKTSGGTGALSIDTNTYLTSIPTATTSVLGGVKPDGTTITITGTGVISAVSTGSGTITVTGSITSPATSSGTLVTSIASGAIHNNANLTGTTTFVGTATGTVNQANTPVVLGPAGFGNNNTILTQGVPAGSRMIMIGDSIQYGYLSGVQPMTAMSGLPQWHNVKFDNFSLLSTTCGPTGTTTNSGTYILGQSSATYTESMNGTVTLTGSASIASLAASTTGTVFFGIGYGGGNDLSAVNGETMPTWEIAMNGCTATAHGLGSNVKVFWINFIRNNLIYNYDLRGSLHAPAYNNWMASQLPSITGTVSASQPDFLIDLASKYPVMSLASGNLYCQSDGAHPTLIGDTLIAQLMSDGLLTPVTSPTTSDVRNIKFFCDDSGTISGGYCDAHATAGGQGVQIYGYGGTTANLSQASTLYLNGNVGPAGGIDMAGSTTQWYYNSGGLFLHGPTVANCGNGGVLTFEDNTNTIKLSGPPSAYSVVTFNNTTYTETAGYVPRMTLNSTGTAVFNTHGDNEIITNTGTSTIASLVITLSGTPGASQFNRYVTMGPVTSLTVTGGALSSTPPTSLTPSGGKPAIIEFTQTGSGWIETY